MRKATKVAGTLALVGAVLAFPAGAAEPVEKRGITVTGTHVVRAAPDAAEWSFGVRARAASARAALRAAAARSRTILAALRAAGVARDDIQTESVSLYPHLDEGTGELDGFQAASSVRVVVRSLGRVGAVVDAATRAGANEVFGPELTTSNRDALYRQALERAYDDARAKADMLARTTGLSLGRPLAVVEGAGRGDGDDPLVARAEAAAMDLAIEPGLNELSASVTVTFAAS
ncbi:MAG TPA: SIMPL domain-containing protein [Gaiellaceae bacterium]|nr:SIMPL domain-containing protein [Gaiellaceae bacterium]